MQAVRALLDSAPTRFGIPSASAVVLRDGVEVFHHTVGLARLSPPRPATEDQVYDLASLTKALAGAPVTAALVASGELSEDLEASHVVASVPDGITVRHLLTHSAGFPAWTPFHAAIDHPGTAAGRRRVLDLAAATPLVYPPGTASIYTDVGFLVLLDLLETVSGEPFQALFRRLVLEPAGAAGLTWGAEAAAATEDCTRRGGVVQGVVHDLNTWSMGGVSTHAGLFGSARDVARLAASFLAPPPALAPTVEVLKRWWHEPSPGTHRGGWDSASPEGYTSVGRRFPADAVGHLGYTGTSVWMSPSAKLVAVLLTNRVHPDDPKDGIRALRPQFHDAVTDCLPGIDRCDA